MHRGLWTLLFLRLRAGARARLRTLRTVRGALSFALGVIVIGMVITGRLVSSMAPDASGELTGDLPLKLSEGVLSGMLGALFLFTLLVSSGPAIYFSPAESVYLFSGPFTRRDHLVYKFCSYLSGLMLTGLIIGLISQRQSNFAATFVGTTMAMLFIQLLATTVSLLDLKLRGQGFPWFRNLVIGLAGGLALWTLSGGVSISDAPASDLAVWPLWPFRIFARAFLAEQLWPDLCLWGSLAILVNALLVGVLLSLDVDFREEVLGKSEQLHRRWVKSHRSGLWSDVTATGWRLPYLLGRSPWAMLIWRQATTALRTYRGALLKLGLLALVWGPLLAWVPSEYATMTIGLSVWLCLFLLPKAVSFDFRSDWDYIGVLRSLPLRPRTIVLAQLAIPVALSTALESIGLLGALPFVSGRTVLYFAGALAVLLPCNALIYAADNLLFLLFPAPQTPMGRLDFEFFGRSLLELLARSTLIGVVLGFSVAGGLILGPVMGGFVIAACLTCWFTAILATTCLIPAMTWAFQRFPLDE